MVRSTLLAALPCLALLATSVAGQALHTVHPDGSADFLSVQAAVDASTPGDVVFVLGGAHHNVVIGRGVTLVMASGGLSEALSGPGAAQPALRIAGLPADETVVISGGTIFIGSSGAPATVDVSDCAGAVWIQDVFVDSYGASSLVAEASASVSIIDTTLQTNLVAALPDGTPQTAAGAEARAGTRLHVYDSELKGSHGALQIGGNPAPSTAPDGGPGLVLVDSLAFLSGSSVKGGSGNSLLVGACLTSGDGGAGLLALDGPGAGAPQATLLGTTVLGGPAGFAPPCAPPTVPGPAFDVPAGSVVSVPSTPRLLTLPGHALQGGTVALGLQGEPGDAAFLLVSLGAAPAFRAAQVELHVALDALVAVVPLALAGQTLTLPVALPVLPGGLETLVLSLQAVVVDTQGARHATNPRALVLR